MFSVPVVQRFAVPKLTVDEKISILSSDSVLIPILVDQSGFFAEQAD